MFGLNKDNAQGQVTELIEKLKSEANLNDEQASKVIETITPIAAVPPKLDAENIEKPQNKITAV